MWERGSQANVLFCVGESEAYSHDYYVLADAGGGFVPLVSKNTLQLLTEFVI